MRDYYAPAVLAAVDYVIAESECHAEPIRDVVPPEKLVVLRNAIDVPQDLDIVSKKDPKRVIFLSSPDRGLGTALKIVAAAQKKDPEIKVTVLYGFSPYERKSRAQMDHRYSRRASGCTPRDSTRSRAWLPWKPRLRDACAWLLTLLLWLRPCSPKQRPSERYCPPWTTRRRISNEVLMRSWLRHRFPPMIRVAANNPRRPFVLITLEPWWMSGLRCSKQVGPRVAARRTP